MFITGSINHNINWIDYLLLVPQAPLGIEASFLSSQSIKLKWNKPDKPNGVISKYVIYWKRSDYSFWETHRDLEWCKRDNVKSGVVNQSPSLNEKDALPPG